MRGVAICLLTLLMTGGGPSWAFSNSTATSYKTLFLSGVIIYGKDKSALFEVREDNRTAKKQVKEGGKIEGYILDKVEKDRVLLKYRGKVKTLLLRRGTVEAAPAGRVGKEVAGKKERVKKRNETSEAEVRRYGPGEIDLSEHKEEVRRGIMELIKSIPNPAGNTGDQ